MCYVDAVIDEFDGQLSLQDIYHMTYKELGYMRKHREKMNKEKGPQLKDIRVN